MDMAVAIAESLDEDNAERLETAETIAARELEALLDAWGDVT
jgi:muconolactone delta-isomerase